MTNTQIKDRLTAKANSLDTAPTDIACTDSGYAALSSNVIDVIKGNLKNQPISFQLFDVVKAPSGGTTVFAVPGITGEEMEKELV